ncbi:MAG: hypothetical protein JWQ99_973 [Blastococcus sp.]|nr:hypothetical protein [Blastococcus sp.]
MAALEATPGVPSAQEVGDGRALVATHRLVPAQLEAVPGVVDAEPSVSVPVLGSPSDRLDRAGHHPAR